MGLVLVLECVAFIFLALEACLVVELELFLVFFVFLGTSGIDGFVILLILLYDLNEMSRLKRRFIVKVLFKITLSIFNFN